MGHSDHKSRGYGIYAAIGISLMVYLYSRDMMQAVRCAMISCIFVQCILPRLDFWTKKAADWLFEN